ncbi:hypothetical protein B0J18DRAFT_265300 [Chaetomium sp. MPI-SDFR-AT-0129]|nr:hypothetical protein B0J18DRAFT_265300 [Chaetomium sp. MPI-SDFR-AT-0129]
MPRRRLTNRSNPATRVHLFCRALAFLFELAVLIFLIYISKTQGYSNGIRYAGVVCAILLNASQVVVLADHHHRLRHVPHPRAGSVSRAALDNQYYMVYTMLVVHGILIGVSLWDFCLQSRRNDRLPSAGSSANATAIGDDLREERERRGDMEGVELRMR